VLGTIIRETIGAIGTARKMGYSPTFLGSSAAYTDLIHKLGGPAMNGLYATHTSQHPYLDEASQPIRFWANKYKTKFNEDPTVFSVYGYNAIDAFAAASPQGRPEPDHRQLHQGHGHHGDPQGHLRQPRSHLRPEEAPGQRKLPHVADHGRQVEGGVGLREVSRRLRQKPPWAAFCIQDTM
jgi:hypothetical protein